MKLPFIFFRIVQDVLWKEIILRISRITDSPKSLGKDNLTICKILDLIIDEEFRIEISNLVENIKRKTNFCRDWRNRRLAHRVLLLSSEKETKELEFTSREKQKMFYYLVQKF